MGGIPGGRLAVSVRGVRVVGMTCVMLVGGSAVGGVVGCIPLVVDRLGVSVVVSLVLDLVLEEVLEVDVLDVLVLELGPVVLQIVVVLLGLQVLQKLMVLLFLSMSLASIIVMDSFKVGLIFVGQGVDSFVTFHEDLLDGFISANVEVSSSGHVLSVGCLLGFNLGVVEFFEFLVVSSLDSPLKFLEVINFLLSRILGGLFFTLLASALSSFASFNVLCLTRFTIAFSSIAISVSLLNVLLTPSHTLSFRIGMLFTAGDTFSLGGVVSSGLSVFGCGV